MTRTAPGELRALTGARGIAAWFVVLFHIRGSIIGAPPWLATLFAKGYLAVDFFFLLSGFVIWLRWGERLHDDRWRAVGPFLRKRIARIWPLHVAMLAATVALALVLWATGRADPVAFPFRELPLHVLLIQNWGFTDHLAWNIPSWSISAELGAYLVFPVVAIAVDWRTLSTTALVAIAGILLTLLCLSFGTASSVGFDIAHVGLVRCLCEFMTGTIVCALWQRGGSTGVAMIGVVLLGCLWMAGVPETMVVPALFALTMFLLATPSTLSAALGLRLPHGLGLISYATYLCHYPLWIMFKLVFVRTVSAVPTAAIAGYVLLVLVASVLLYRYLERPAQQLIDGIARPPP